MDYRHALLHRINYYRHEHGLHRLIIGRRLQRAATAHSINMADHHMLSHSSYSGTNWLTRLRAYGFTGAWAGENLAVGLWTPRHVMRAWRASPDHNANLLNGHYTAVGIGVVRGMWSGHTAYYVTADFGGR
ncbi:MAG TPA: CAP domain-containing protein [Gaiellales bacterium]|nr:CAP domain-containing protein [Gaiellales bacterium]